MKKPVAFTLVTVAVLIIAAGLFGILKFGGKREFRPTFQKGMCYTTWNKNAYESRKSDRSLEKLKGINVEYVSILITWYQNSCFSTEIYPTDRTPSDESVRHAIRKAHELGMKVMLKPHVDLVSKAEGGWRGEITCVREADWQKWFESYKNFVLHCAKIAEEEGAELICIGTELTAATAGHTDNWLDIISAVRKVYGGDLTYAANWNEEYLQIRFWDALDYAGIDAYFPLSDKPRPTYGELMESWKKWVPEIEEWQASIEKPVIFPEVGYHSALEAAKHPWEHGYGPKVDLELQKDCYRALVDTFWDKDWFYGVYWWDWGTDVRMGGKSNRGFTPQNKPAQDYLEKLYGKRAPR